jgi:hypothetical protein
MARCGVTPTSPGFLPQPTATSSVAPVSAAEPPGDYLGSFFFPDGKLGVVWTRRVLTIGTTLQRDIYFIKQK